MQKKRRLALVYILIANKNKIDEICFGLIIIIIETTFYNFFVV